MTHFFLAHAFFCPKQNCMRQGKHIYLHRTYTTFLTSLFFPFSLYKHAIFTLFFFFSGVLDETQRYPPAHCWPLHIHIGPKVWGYSPSAHWGFRPEDTLSTKERLWNLWMPNRNYASHGTFCIPQHSRLVFVLAASYLSFTATRRKALCIALQELYNAL